MRIKAELILLELMQRTNAEQWKGTAAGTIKLSDVKWTKRSTVVTAFHRSNGWAMDIQGMQFQLYAPVNIKYALRSINRAGLRNVRIKIAKEPRRLTLAELHPYFTVNPLSVANATP